MVTSSPQPLPKSNRQFLPTDPFKCRLSYSTPPKTHTYLIDTCQIRFFADRTIGRAFGTLCCLSSFVCLSVTFCIVAKWYVLAKNCLKEWIGNQGQKVDFSQLPPYFYFQFRLYSHWYGRFCLIFAQTAQWLVLDGTNGLSSSKPCAYCRIVRPFKWIANSYSFALRIVKAYVRNCSNLRPYDCIWTMELVSHVSRQALFITVTVAR